MPIFRKLQLQTKRNLQHNLLIIGKLEDFSGNILQEHAQIPTDIWTYITETIAAEKKIFLTLQKKKIQCALIPHSFSRHNSPTGNLHITKYCSDIQDADNWDILLSCSEKHALAAVSAIAKTFPTFSTKTSGNIERLVNIILLVDGTPCISENLSILLHNTRLCCNIVDRPPNMFHIPEFILLAKDLAEHPNVSIQIIQGKNLAEQGLGGIWNVGKAAEKAPALVCIEWIPRQDGFHIGMVGKGIIYDTGGLSIKQKTSMPGMKTDMAGAAAVFYACKSLVESNFPWKVTIVLCLAENAVNEKALRPDDIITMYSGKTVEVNNTDAEGRLVLADGVAWLHKHKNPNVIMDIATLTGAASAAVGKNLAAIYTNNEQLEQLAIAVGQNTGELCHPLPYIPEFWSAEFYSTVADMTNSVRDRSNAQSACAGQFIQNHLNSEVPWIHIDIAGSATRGTRATGFGVALLLELAHSVSGSSLDAHPSITP